MPRAGPSVLLAAVALFLVVPSASASITSPGDLDATFGEHGKVITSFGWTYESLMDVAIQSDGRIVAAGIGGHGDRETVGVVLTYRDTGKLDRSFGNRGRVVLHSGDAEFDLHAVAVQPDGKIIAAGRDGGIFHTDFAVVRLDPDGSLDAGFGDEGIVRTSFTGEEDGANDVLPHPDGRILAVGVAGDRFSSSTFALARYLPDGSLDPTFGHGGMKTASFPGADAVEGLGAALAPDGSIVVVRSTGVEFIPSEIAVARFRPNGSLDRRFGRRGRVLTDIRGEAYGFDVVIQSNGRIVVAGAGLGRDIEKFAVLRYLPDGSLDRSFGHHGVVLTGFGHCDRTCGSDSAEAVALQPDGRIVAAGIGWAGDRRRWNLALARYLPDGSLDGSFGNGGLVLTRDFDMAHGLALQPDGKVLVVGAATGASDKQVSRFCLARYLVGP